jgi:DNA-binding NarL/FixJ family response regulator
MVLHSDKSDRQDDGGDSDGEERTKGELFQAYLDADPELEVIGVTEDTSKGSLDALVTDLAPDIVLMSVNVLRPVNVERLRVIRESRPEAVIILVAENYDSEGIDQLREFSRSVTTGYAYLSLDTFANKRRLTDTISLAAAGHVIVEPEIMDGLMGAQGYGRSLFSTLEPWERNVLRLMVRSFPDDAVTGDD